jgi:CRISPR-associated endonuclease/helicase Cas3
VAIASRAQSFESFFTTATGGFAPYHWQNQVALNGLPDVLPVPTGLGKTEIALAWAWRLLVDKKPEPLHLVVCLPMRSLVTQTEQRLKAYFDALKATKPELEVGVHRLMGGAIEDKWVRQPDEPWVLVGTQDQLLSRALNRGYAMSRFEWPVHFGFLNNDCRWIIDEVQLMGPGLWTTSQLDWMRRRRFPSLKPCLTTWMSATVGTSFLSTTDRTREGLGEASPEQVALEGELTIALKGDQNLQWWRDAKRPVEWWRPTASDAKTTGARTRGATKSGAVTPEAIATAVTEKHEAGTLSLVICNTVDMARDVFRALASVDHKVLLTSRFRREDRARHEQRLLEFDTNRKSDKLPKDDPGLICVSTQVVEAGVDISAHRLWTELAPWPSMLQRLGRLNRKGDDRDAHAWVWETPKASGRGKSERIGPYEAADIERARKLVNAIAPLSQQKPFAEAIADLSTQCSKEIGEALQPKPSPLPRALDVHGLFSTERDVHGGFTDVSAFVRGTDPDLDVTVFWRDWSGDNPPRGDDLDGPLLEPAQEGCPVSFARVQKMLESSKGKAWLWDDEADRWERVQHWDIRPGMLVMLKRDVGGYDTTEGWTGDKSNALAEVPRAGRGATLRDDAWTEIGYWSKLEDHLKDARGEAEKLCDALGLRDGEEPCPVCKNLSLPHDKGRCAPRAAVVEASGLHDLGKAHPQWQAALPDWCGISGIPDGLLAKTPHILAVDVLKSGDLSKVRDELRNLRPTALQLSDHRSPRGPEIVRLRWVVDDRPSSTDRTALEKLADVYWAGEPAFRPRLRHEVASALAMWRKYRDSDKKPYPALAVYLAATHHGKARTVLRSTTSKGDDVFGVRSEPSSLVIGTAQWPLDFSIAKDGAEGRWEGNEFVLTGYGWTGLVADLLGPWRPEEKSDVGVVPETEPRRLGPFALAYLEALVRVADRRASENPSESVAPSRIDESVHAGQRLSDVVLREIGLPQDVVVDPSGRE